MNQPEIEATERQHARAAYLRELFEPWSLRRLEARTGIGRGTLQTRFNGSTALTVDDIEILAPVVRMTPEELFSELMKVSPEPAAAGGRPTIGGGTRLVGDAPLIPFIGSRVGPTGIEPMTSTV